MQARALTRVLFRTTAGDARSRRGRLVAFALCGALTAVDLEVVTPNASASASARRPLSAPAAGKTEPLVAADVASAQLTARVRGVRVEVLSARGEEETTYANPDGSFTTENYLAPVRVRDSKNEHGWSDVDLTLTASADGAVVPEQHSHKIKLAGKAAANGVLTQIDGGKGRQIGYRWLKKLPTPVLEGNRATYRGVEPGVDLVQEVTRTSVEQFVILKDRAAADTVAEQAVEGVYHLRIPVQLRGLSPRERADGGIDFLDAKGVVAQTVPAPRAWDAALVPNADVPANVIEPKMTFEARGSSRSRGDLVVAVDAAWLQDPARQFPITIDPTTTMAAAHDTYVQSDTTSPQAGSSELRVGTFNGSTKARSFMKWSTSAFRGASVTSATLSLWNFHSWSCTAKPMNIHSSATTDVNTTWANQPSAGTLRYSPSFAKGYSGCAAGWQNINVTSLAQAWAASTATAQGIRLSASESDVTGWKKFNSANASSNVPKLSVTYNRYPNTAGTTTHTPGTASATSTAGWATSATPTVKAVVSDPDGGSVKGLFSVYLNGTGSPIIDKASGSTVTSGGTSQYAIPAGKLANGSRYLVRAWASDGTLVSKTYGGYDNFVVDNTAPATPTVASSTSPENQWSATVDGNGKVAFSATSSAADTAKMQYSLDTATYASTVTASANQAVSIALAKPATGKHTLYVRALDKAGNASPGKAYVFYFGSGIALAQPVENHVTARRIPLQLQIDPGQVSALGAHSYQYRRGATDSWRTVPLTDVTNAAGTTLTAWPSTAAPTTAVSYWDAAKTLSGGGVIDVRATFAGNSSTTDPNTVVVDINAGQAGTAQAGPGEVNLLTGEYSVSANDATLFGASIGRSYGSRSLTAGQDNGQGGAFGPQWNLSSGDEYLDTSWKFVRKTSTVSVELQNADGSVVAFTAANGGGWTPEPGSEELELTGSLAGSFTLTDTDGNSTTFAKPTGVTGAAADVWPASSASSAASGGTARYGYTVDTAGKLRLARIAAPNAALSGTALRACADPTSNLLAADRRGCRILELVWSSPADAQTGGYAGQRVTAVKSYAWDPATANGAGAMTSRTEATYGYDSTGQLTSVTDPRPGQAPGGRALTTSYRYDSNGLLTGLTPPGRQPWTFSYATSATAGPAWDRDLPTSKGRLTTVERPILAAGTASTVNGTARTAVVYGVPLTTAAGGPADLNLATTGQWGQNVAPVDGTAVFDVDAAAQPTNDHWAGDDTTARSWSRASVTYMDVNGREVNTRNRDGLMDATVYDRNGNTVFELDGGNRALALGQGVDADATLAELGLDGLTTDARATNLATVTIYETGASGAARAKTVQSPVRTVVTASGAQEQQRPTQRLTYDAGRPDTATTSDRVTSDTTGGLGIDSDPATATLDNARTTTTSYDWSLGLPLDVTSDPSPASGDEITVRTRYDAKGRTIKQQQPADNDGSTAGTRVTTYWGEANGPCADRPEWGDLVCRTSYAAAISGSTGNTDLPTTTTSYNRAGAAASTAETANGVTRTSTTTYDAADRPTTTSIAGDNLGGPIATRTLTYAADTGEMRTLTADGKTITTITDSLGRPISYTDATGLRGTTTYDALGRPLQASETDTAAGGLDRSFTRTTTYDDNTGRVTSVDETQAGAVTVGYDAAGNVAKQTHTASDAGGLQVASRYDTTGAEVERVWTMTGLAEPVLSESVVQNIHGQQVDHTQMPGGHRTYTYDNTGRHANTVELDADQCTVRAYRFDQNSNRTGRNIATTDAGVDGNGDAVVCPTPATPSVDASYDTGDRLTNAGYVYDAFGRTTRMPDSDGRVMRLGFHVNDLVATQTLFANATDADANNGAGQNPVQSTTYTLDPTSERVASRTMTAVNPDTNTTDTVTKTLRYSSGNDAPTWTDEGDGTITRSISGPGGDLAATATITKAGTATDVVTRQITSIHGDVAATLPANEAEPLQISRSDEYGSDSDDTPRYGWLGAKERASDTPGGLVLMGIRLYSPDTGRFLTTDPVYGGNANTYTYPTDPVNMYDLDGRCGFPGLPWVKCKKPGGTFVTDMYGNKYRVRKKIVKKIESKHNFTMAALKRFMRVASAFYEGGTTYEYLGYAKRYSCSGILWWAKCKLVEQRVVRAVVDTRRVGKGSYGVVTAYCVGSVKCPGWVNNAF